MLQLDRELVAWDGCTEDWYRFTYRADGTFQLSGGTSNPIYSRSILERLHVVTKQTDKGQTNIYILYYNTRTLGNAHFRLSTCMCVCNPPFDTTPVSDRCETRRAGRDRESETNGRVGFRLDRLRRPETRLWRPEICTQMVECTLPPLQSE